jgi:lipopolysaccharide transport system ATP-binding protein
MKDSVIVVENLSKSYLLGHQVNSGAKYKYDTLRDVIGREVRNFIRNASRLARGHQIVQGDEIEEFWALKDVSFEVKRGEVIGIIGRNGAGKSTLLKILSKITEPTKGRVLLNGRVASLLEVGTGFHPELSGRENIFLNGAILGMTRQEVRRKFDEIVAFAEVEKFLDTPVKRYSSGMYVRLAFAVAAHLEPEILIVDEVLAVGDAEFQKKCLGKMDDVSRRGGRTVLFVSHSMGALTTLCPNAIWLDRGAIREVGPTKEIVAKYLSQRMSDVSRTLVLGKLPRPSLVDDDRLRLESLEWLCDLPLRHGEPVKARIHFGTRTPVLGLAIGIGFSTLDGRRLLTYETDFQGGLRPNIDVPGTYSVDIEISSLPLAPDIYEFDIGCRSGDFHALDYLAGGIQLEIIAGPHTPGHLVHKDAGVRLESKWTWRHDTPKLRLAGKELESQ